MTQPDYFTRYQNLAFDRDESGVLTLRFHTDGGPVVFTGQTHEDLQIERAVAWDGIEGASRYADEGVTLFTTEIHPTEAGYDLSPLEEMLSWRDSRN